LPAESAVTLNALPTEELVPAAGVGGPAPPAKVETTYCARALGAARISRVKRPDATLAIRGFSM
jgi:hypothetical protein